VRPLSILSLLSVLRAAVLRRRTLFEGTVGPEALCVFFLLLPIQETAHHDVSLQRMQIFAVFGLLFERNLRRRARPQTDGDHFDDAQITPPLHEMRTNPQNKKSPFSVQKMSILAVLGLFPAIDQNATAAPPSALTR